MKKALLFLGMLALGCQAFAQTSVSLADVVSSGTILYDHTFGQTLLPYLKNKTSQTVHKTIIPKTYVVAEDMSIKRMIVNYNIRMLDLSKAGNIVSNFADGNFRNVRLSKEKPNLVFVEIPHADYVEGYVVNVFFSSKRGKWMMVAHDVNDPELGYIQGTRILTY